MCSNVIEKQYEKIFLLKSEKIIEAAYTLETLPDILYHGSFKEFTKIQTPIFLTPFQGIASMFIVNKNELDRVMKTSNIKPPNSFQTDYKEWAYKDSKLKNPLKFVHILHNIKTLENTVLNGTSVGYIYAIDIRPIKKELDLFLKSSANREVVYKGNKELKIIKRIPHSIEWSFSYSLELAEWLNKQMREDKKQMKVKKLKITKLREVDIMKNEDPISLRQITPILVSAMNKIKSLDDRDYILTLGVYGATAKETRTKKSPIDIYVFLNTSAIKKPIINKERAVNSLYGIPTDYWEPIRAIIVDEFGINPFTQKPYVINIVSAYEVKNKKDSVYTDMLVLKNNRLVSYRSSFGESEFSNKASTLLIEGSTVLNFPNVITVKNQPNIISVLVSVLAYYGIEVNAETLCCDLNTEKLNTTFIRSIIRVLKKYNLNVDQGIMNIDMLQNYIDRKIPIIVVLNKDVEEELMPCDESEHFVVVMGYTDTKIFFEDPITNERNSLTIAEFDKKWKDIMHSNNIFRKFGIAAYKDEADYPNTVFQDIE